ncbi:MAG: hypothetical protein ABFD90_19610 [Phycisphaerales bacterium]
MAKNKRIAFYIPEEWSKGLSALAGTYGVSAEEVIRQSLPDDAAIGLFFQCRVYAPDLRWDEMADVGRAAIRERLRTAYMEGLQTHLTRLGLGIESSGEEVETAKQRALDDLGSDAAKPIQEQIARAQEDSVYLGCLHEAWKRARAGEAGYTIAQVEIASNDGAGRRKTWAVLKDNQIV